MSVRPSSVPVLAVVLLSLAAAGCAKHTGILAPRITDPLVFTDDFAGSVDWQSFGGSKLDALSIDKTVSYSGAASVKLTVPAPGDPSGGYAGGAFTTTRTRDLSGYDALTFRARADHAITVDVVGIGNDNTGTSRHTAEMRAVAMDTAWALYVIPLPLASRLTDEGGLFFISEGPEGGAGASIWLDDIMFAKLGTIVNESASIPTLTLKPDVGSLVTFAGAQVTCSVAGVPQTLGIMPGYFTFVSSADTVAVGGEGTLRAVGFGTATVTASLGGLPATGVLTLVPNPIPVAGAPVPTLPAASVRSLFSNSYPNATTVDTWSTTWDGADVADVKVAGNDTKKYTNLVFAAVEFTGAHTLDATAMTHLHLDVWAAGGTNVKVKLVDFGANGVFGGGDDREHELTFTAASTPALSVRTWSSLEIPLAAFTRLTTRGHLAQMFLGGDTGTLYVDNVYFHQ